MSRSAEPWRQTRPTGQVPEFVQPIAVSRTGSHEDVVRAVALASVTAYMNTGDRYARNWNDWLAGPFTKSVRRGTNTQFDEADRDSAAYMTSGEARAIASIPMDAELLRGRKPWCKMQVSHMERERHGFGDWEMARFSAHVAINPQVGMTTGKTAAQVAHGLFAWYLSLSPTQRHHWAIVGMPFDIADDQDTWRAFSGVSYQGHRTEIVDAGRTEIAPNTLTVVVL